MKKTDLKKWIKERRDILQKWTGTPEDPRYEVGYRQAATAFLDSLETNFDLNGMEKKTAGLDGE